MPSRRPRLLDVRERDDRWPDADPACRLVSPSWVAEHLDDPGVVVLDMRWRESRGTAELFEREHIPRSRPLDWSADIVDPDHPAAFMLARPDAFAEAMAARGIGDDTTVVAYADHRGSGPFRLWWAFRRYGHDTVCVLDGGLDEWRASGGALEDGPPGPVERRTWTPGPPLDVGTVATADDVRHAADPDAATLVLDSRSPDQFRGDRVWFETGPVEASDDGIAHTPRGDLRAGRVPWARNVPWAGLYGTDGRLLSPEDLRTRFRAAGVEPDSRVIAYCGVGISASALLFALRRAGVRDVALYDGSWDEWGRLEDAPVARG